MEVRTIGGVSVQFLERYRQVLMLYYHFHIMFFQKGRVVCLGPRLRRLVVLGHIIISCVTNVLFDFGDNHRP